MALEVPFYDAPVVTWRAPYNPRSIGTFLGKNGALTGDDGCGCHPMWWLLAAAAFGVAAGVYAKKDEKKKRRRKG